MRWRNLECFAWRLCLLCSAARTIRADHAAAGQRQQHREAKHASLPPPQPPARSVQCLLGLGRPPCTAHCLSEWAAKRSGLLAAARYSQALTVVLEKLYRGTLSSSHCTLVANSLRRRSVAPPPLFQLCQVGQYLEPGAICVRRRRRRHIAAAAAWCGGERYRRRDEATYEATSENPDQNQDAVTLVLCWLKTLFSRLLLTQGFLG